MKSSRASKIISGILLTPALLILLSLLIILPSTALAQLESFVHSIQDPSTTLHFSWNNLTVKTLYSPWSIMTLLFCIYKVTPAYNLILKQAIYGIKQTWLSFNTSNDSLYNSQETMPCTYHQENLKQQQQSHRQSNRKKQPQLHLVNNVKKEVEEEKEPQQQQQPQKEKEEEEKESSVEIKQNITIAATIANTASITKQEDNTDPVEWTVVKEKSSKKKKRTKTKRNNNMQVPTFVNSNSQIKNKTSKPVKGLSSSANNNHVNGINTVMTPITTSTTSVTDSTSGNTNPKKIKNKTNNNNNIKTTNTDITPITFAATVAATTSTATATRTTSTFISSVKPNNNNNNDNNDWQMETNLFQDNDKQETLYSVSNSSEDENQPDVPFLSDNESSGSESPCSTHNSLPPPLQDEPTSNYYSPFSTGFDFGVATSIPTGHIYDDGQEDIWNPTRHHQWESGFLRPLYYTHQNHHHHQHKTSLLHLLNQPDKVETTITSESFRYFDDMVMSNTLYSSPPLQKSRVPRDWDSVLSASHHEIK